jgi:hypothetical protein
LHIFFMRQNASSRICAAADPECDVLHFRAGITAAAARPGGGGAAAGGGGGGGAPRAEAVPVLRDGNPSIALHDAEHVTVRCSHRRNLQRSSVPSLSARGRFGIDGAFTPGAGRTGFTLPPSGRYWMAPSICAPSCSMRVSVPCKSVTSKVITGV